MFTLSLGNPDVKSDLMIGGIPESISYDNITWNKLSDSEFWNLKLKQMDFNDMVEVK